MERSSFFVMCLCIVACGHYVLGLQMKEDAARLMRDTFRMYDNNVIPINGEPLNVSISLGLTSIRDVDTERGEVEITAMRTIMWRDPTMAWADVNMETSIPSFSVNIKHLWTPDITAYNAIHAPELLSPPLARISEDGGIVYVPNERIRFSCNLENLESPEGANCTIKYGSWTYHSGELNLKLANEMFSTWHYVDNPRFQLLTTYSEVTSTHYACCTEAYQDAKFTLNLRKKSTEGSFFVWKK